MTISCRALALAGALFFLAAPGHLPAADEASLPESYKPDDPPAKIASVKEVVLHDSKRDKDLPLRITHPELAGPLPVIIWSHGAYGSKDIYQPLAEYWAAHGYAVIQPTHEDSIALGNRFGDPAVFRIWRTRPADVSFILDSFAEIESKVPGLKGKLDPQHVGVGGHSFGAGTAQLVGGAMTYGAGGEKSFADPRATAIMLLSGQGPGEMLTEKSWENFTRPLFVMTGSADGPARTGQPAEWRKKPYELSPSGDKYLVWVEGLDHGFGGITGVRLNLLNHKTSPAQVKYTKLATLAFWDAYLKGDREARAFLESDKLSKLSDGEVKLEHK